MANPVQRPVQALILALPETAGSALYGMIDVLGAAGTLWRQLVGDEPGLPLIEPRVVALGRDPFCCGNGIPVQPACGIGDQPEGDVVIVPELWLAPDDDLRGRYTEACAWVRARHAAGCFIYSACSGAVLLAATGLLDGRAATSHWAYRDLFRRSYPQVRFRPEPNLVFADPEGRIVTAGGTTSWHDLALHIVARHCGLGEALRLQKVYLMKWHGEGQLPYASLIRQQPHADAVVRRVEKWLADQLVCSHPVAGAVAVSGIPERSLKRRFKAATGTSLLHHVQNLRVEKAKRLLEETDEAVDEIAAATGYDNPAFFRRLFKRSTGLAPGEYRRMFSTDLQGA